MAVAIWRDAKRGWCALFGVMFGVAIAGSAMAAYVGSANNVTTRVVGRGADVINEEVGGGGGGGQAPPIAEKNAVIPPAR
jgi:hypothetical protein